MSLVRLKDLQVDAVDHRALAQWWADVWGGTVTIHPAHVSVTGMPGWPAAVEFSDVPEPRTAKNRVHWDVTLEPGATVDDLVAAGASVLRGPTDEDRWTVMADPEGNEFCVFPAPSAE